MIAVAHRRGIDRFVAYNLGFGLLGLGGSTGGGKAVGGIWFVEGCSMGCYPNAGLGWFNYWMLSMIYWKRLLGSAV